VNLNIDNYTLIKKEDISEVNGTAYLLEHNKTKAKVLYVKNDDKNKVFYIGFRTPPTNDTGVAHITEHSVLCGSKKFPAKDPFVELAKGSLNTFLNAMTYPDKTVYPIASVNDKDYHNLMDVYLDAVFYPNTYTNDKILKQEGWHYHLENEDDDITYNGVVYNEMKGAYSSAEQQLMQEIQRSLLPQRHMVAIRVEILFIFLNFHTRSSLISTESIIIRLTATFIYMVMLMQKRNLNISIRNI
jgi:hypothetical protein